ncbi:choline O-acetyltransferase-like [Mizuhopecten yessoensis]|uniref:Choline O-acetyltransferase n=1 Tax=Mizuhopecten yessoensis TaxID=6573 RepID=A0A210PJB5_MIZYE|nr:choline O-acetyltransferase-like [Mizuhopecten yessoensis]OWF36575.1 Choline O-acetyltransferase [Mizuhopecten yessoensis]
MATGHVKEYIKRVASIDQEIYPKWDLMKPLPKLPVPELHSTFQKYLAIIRPIVSPQQYLKTKALIKEFCDPGGDGEILQEQLKLFAESKENWAYSWWLDDMYMKNRLPLPINSNPGMIFPKQHFIDRRDQLRYATRLISGILDYKTIIDARGLPIDRARHKIKGQPLCMEQYYRLFTSYRVPGVNKDSLISNTSKLMREPEHIIVICKNQFFVLDVVINFTRLSEDDLLTQLHRIYKMAEEVSDAEPVGILTAAYRDRWADARIKLMQDSSNRDSLDAIERSIFILCLDSSIPISFNHQNSIDETNLNIRDEVSLLYQMLHGFGTKQNGANRWYDKTMQFIISQDGACGLCYEHSPSEGIAVVQLIEHLLRYMEEIRMQKLTRMQSICEIPYPRKLNWKVSEEVHQRMEEATSHINRIIVDLDLFVLRFERFGRDFPKSQNMSPDSFIQLALQLTYYKVHHRLVSTYESASTRRFRLGRVDNIRANSPQALDWVKAMVGETELPDSEIIRLLRKAMEWQTDIMTQTILGHGVDIHFLGLREIALETERDLPTILKDEVFQISNHFSLSTSQVPTTMDAMMCYGPVVPDGYGVCYNPHPDNIVVCVTSFKSSSETSSAYFAYTLESSFLQMRELLIKVTEEQAVLTCSRSNSIERRNGDLTRSNSKNGSPRRSKLVRQKHAQNTNQEHPQNGSSN